MNVLAIDTSTDICSIALSVNGQCWQENQVTPQTHANLMLPMIETLMADAQVTPEQLDALVYGEGPGAFTGVRIAAGVIQGLALGWDKPVAGVSGLVSMALAWRNEQPKRFQDTVTVAAFLDARMKELYLQWQTFDAQTQQWQFEAPQLLSEAAALAQLQQRQAQSPVIGCGDIAQEFPVICGQFSGDNWREAKPNALAMIDWCALHPDSFKSLEQVIPQPLYLRNNVAETIAEREAKKAQQKAMS